MNFIPSIYALTGKNDRSANKEGIHICLDIDEGLERKRSLSYTEIGFYNIHYFVYYLLHTLASFYCNTICKRR